MSGISAGLVGTVVSKLEHPGDVVVAPGDGREVLLDLGLELSEALVGIGQLSNLLADAGELGLVVLDNLDRVVVVNSDGLQLGPNLGGPLDSDVVLLDRATELLLDVIVGRGELHDLLSLSLGGHLELAIGLV